MKIAAFFKTKKIIRVACFTFPQICCQVKWNIVRFSDLLLHLVCVLTHIIYSGKLFKGS